MSQPAFRKPVVHLIAAALALLAGPIWAGADDLHFPPDRPCDMQHIKLDLAVDLKAKRIEGTATLTMNVVRETATVHLDAVNFQVRGVTAKVGGTAASGVRHSTDGKGIDVVFASPLLRGQAVEIVVDYAVQEPKDGLHFFGPSAENPDEPLQVWSQGESQENRYWFPGFDHPSEMQTTELIATVPSIDEVLSNGKLVSKEPAGADKMRFHWVQDKPHATYLVTMVVGEFAIKSDTWRGKPVLYYVPKNRVDDAARSFANTPKMLEFFSTRLGVEYAWDKYAQVCCYNYGGGMENTSATTLGENTLHDERAHLDRDSEGLVSHELAHQWFGDLVTCRDWAHIWLNEGFASYFEALWDEELNGEDAFAWNMMDKARAAIGGGKDKPIVYRAYKSADEQFDSRAYPKGAWVVHMLRRRVGDELFWKSLNYYLTTHRYHNVETTDLRDAFEHVAGGSFERFFYDWTYRPGAPEVTLNYSWDEPGRTATVEVKQTQKEDAFEFPLTIEFAFADGKTQRVTEPISEKTHSFEIPLAAMPTMVNVDPDNAVLMELKENKPRELWQAELTGDKNPVGRSRAARAIAEKKDDLARTSIAAAFAKEPFKELRGDLADILGDLGGDNCRDALLAGVKDKESRVRAASIRALQKFKKDAGAADAIEAVARAGDRSYSVESAAIEALTALKPDEAMPTLKAALERDSSRDVIRAAALRSLGRLKDPAAVAILLDWAAPSKSPECRDAAVGALAGALRRSHDDPATVARAVDAMTAMIKNGNDSWRVRAAAARALGELGHLASDALPALHELDAANPGGRFSRSIKSAIDDIEKDEKPAGDKLADLNSRIETLTKENAELKERIKSLEAAKAAGSHASGDSHSAGNSH